MIFKKRFLKMHQKKLKALTNMSKSKKSAYFRYIFPNNFVLWIFSKFFNGFEFSVKFCVFLYPSCVKYVDKRKLDML
jgi:hypothetical protein